MKTNSTVAIGDRFTICCRTIIRLGLAKNARQLSTSLGMRHHAFSGIIYGRVDPPLEKVQMLCAMYSINAQYLFGRSNTIFLKPPAKKETIITTPKESSSWQSIS